MQPAPTAAMLPDNRFSISLVCQSPARGGVVRSARRQSEDVTPRRHRQLHTLGIEPTLMSATTPCGHDTGESGKWGHRKPSYGGQLNLPQSKFTDTGQGSRT